MRARRWTWMAAGLGFVACAASRADDSPARVGPGSCSARSCHGGVGPPGTLHGEFHTWANLDPHREAAEALTFERSREMQRLLKRQPDATADPLCQSCHGRIADPAAPGGHIGGVDCESCHGEASLWLATHYLTGKPDEPRGWARATDAERQELGFRPMHSERELARNCTRCHVGAAIDQQVNHDLIAAGHPRLNFELASYLDRLPRHWDSESTDKDRADRDLPPRTPARTWAVGQVETMKAGVDLLAARASLARVDPHPTWPEFSEFACFSCHHALHDLGTKYGPSRPRTATLPWNVWMATPLREIAGLDLDESVAPGPLSAPSVDLLASLMSGRLADAGGAAGVAVVASEALGGWSGRLDSAGPESARLVLHRYLARLGSDPDAAARATANWDAATQLLLAMGAAVRELAAHPEAADPSADLAAFEVRRRQVLRRLEFPQPSEDEQRREHPITRYDGPGADREPAPPPGPDRGEREPTPEAIQLREELSALIKDAPGLFKPGTSPAPPAASRSPNQPDPNT